MRVLWRSPTIRSTVVLGTAGAGFVAANLNLARLLPTEEYALFTLVVALVNVGFALAPAGIDGMVNRLRLEAGPRLLGRTMRATAPVGILFGLIGLAGYALSPSLALMILVATATGGALMVAGAQFQSEQRYGISWPSTAGWPRSWARSSASSRWASGPRCFPASARHRTCWCGGGSSPGSPSTLVAAVVGAGSLAIWVVTPLVERLILAGKYHLTAPLILAALITGVAKILNAFTKATVSALADTRELAVVNALGWVSVAVAVVASAFGARWGLVGVICGVGLGWLVRAVSAMYYTARHLRLPSPAPAMTP